MRVQFPETHGGSNKGLNSMGRREVGTPARMWVADGGGTHARWI